MDVNDYEHEAPAFDCDYDFDNDYEGDRVEPIAQSPKIRKECSAQRNKYFFC